MRTFALIGMALLAMVSARPEPPVSQYLPPNQQYGLPQNPGFSGGNNYQRGGPTGGHSSPGGLDNSQYLPPNQRYGVPGFSGGSADGNGYYDTPAKYEFEYTVNDGESGNDFGHKESRDGDAAHGIYYVLLPDGRRQTVEYEADNNGFRPRITYSQEGYANRNTAGNSYDNNNNVGAGGYRY